MSKPIQTNIEIYGQVFTVRAEPDEEKNLQRVAAEVNEFLRELSRKGAVPLHRLALMAAFQYAYELDITRNCQGISKELTEEMNKKIDDIIGKLQDALEQE